MATTLTWTVAECIAQISSIETKIEELRGLPTSGRVGKTALDHRNTLAELRTERELWLERLATARNQNRPRPRRRVV